jgi:hypothetical protein
MKILRDGEIYDVIEYLPDSKEVCVIVKFDFTTEPQKKDLKLWWDLKYCKIINDC